MISSFLFFSVKVYFPWCGTLELQAMCWSVWRLHACLLPFCLKVINFHTLFFHFWHRTRNRISPGEEWNKFSVRLSVFFALTLGVLGGRAEDAGESHAEELDRSKTKLDVQQVREGPATPKQMMCTSGQMSQCTIKWQSCLIWSIKGWLEIITRKK